MIVYMSDIPQPEFYDKVVYMSGIPHLDIYIYMT